MDDMRDDQTIAEIDRIIAPFRAMIEADIPVPIDRSSPARIAHWVLFFAGRIGAMWAQAICRKHPVDPTLWPPGAEVWPIVAFYTRQCLITIACDVLGKTAQASQLSGQGGVTRLSLDVNALVQASLSLEREEWENGIKAQSRASLGNFGGDYKSRDEIWHRIESDIEADTKRRFTVFQQALPADGGALAEELPNRLAHAIADEFYPATQRPAVAESVRAGCTFYTRLYVNCAFGR